jgi:hypothetical protein
VHLQNLGELLMRFGEGVDILNARLILAVHMKFNIAKGSKDVTRRDIGQSSTLLLCRQVKDVSLSYLIDYPNNCVHEKRYNMI